MLHRALSVLLVVPLVAVSSHALASASADASRPRCHGLLATVVGTQGADRLTGTAGRDVIVARGGDDRVDGRGGDDVICGGDGADTLIGGPGGDRLYGGQDLRERHGRRLVVTGDRLEGGPGDDLLDAGPAIRGADLIRQLDRISFEHSARPVHVDLAGGTATGEGHDTIVRERRLEVDGTPYDDVLLGSRLPETLDGGRGDDTVDGRGGSDAVLGYHGDDVLDGGDGRDLVIGTAGWETLRGGAGFDMIIAGSPHPTTVLGGPSFDLIDRSVWGGPVGTIDGGPGSAQLELEPQVFDDEDNGAVGVLDRGAGTARLTWGSRERVVEFAGIRAFTLWGGQRWTFLGTDADDFVQVLEAPLSAQTLGGDDTILGGDRNDTLDAGDGTDSVWGGGGHNECLHAEKGDCDGYPWDREPRLSARTSHRAVLAWVTAADR
ncbi:calcium-binding protein [Nocardioides conyzicola]|uniref:Calcium-binding protein n=1 Tax=Nocardioides conyzicola TaxID=1651781 RepID=A0ABP8XWH5_9ACTN